MDSVTHLLNNWGLVHKICEIWIKGNLFCFFKLSFRSFTKNLSVEILPPQWKAKQNGTLRSTRNDVLPIGMHLIPWHPDVLKARHSLIFNTDFCTEYFPQTCFWQRSVSSKTQTAPSAVKLRKILFIFSGTVQTLKRFGETWLPLNLLISTLYLETTWRISQFF